MEKDDFVLGICDSLTAYSWVSKCVDPQAVAEMVRQKDLPEIVARILVARDIQPQGVDFFLNPTLGKHLPDPFILKDMDKATERIFKAIEGQETIAVFGDYDVDGATSTALLTQFLIKIGAKKVIARLPERQEGYGVTIPVMQELIGNQKTSLLITVDNGITAFEPLKTAVSLGADVIIVDHHEPDVSLPDVYAIINPKRIDEPIDHPCRTNAAVGLVFLLVVALNRLLRQKGWYQTTPEPDLRSWLDLVALGTVCDVVSLRGLNRLFVKTGLGVLAKRGNKGLAVLSDLSGIKETPTAYHLGYLLGPRLNACGRIGKASLGLELLSAENEEQAHQVALALDELNNVRRALCETVLRQATVQVDQNSSKEDPVVFVYGQDWHAGIIGIIAGRLKERYKKPAFVLSLSNDEVRGSARSIEGMHVGSVLLQAVEQGVLTKGGGHAMAGGFSLKVEKISDFKAFLQDQMLVQTKDSCPLILDGLLDLGAVNQEFVDVLARLEPFGEDNLEPKFAVANVAVSYPKVCNGGHVACTLVGRNGKTKIRAIAFKASENNIGQALLNSKGALYHVAGLIRPDAWRGAGQAQMIIEDLALAT